MVCVTPKYLYGLANMPKLRKLTESMIANFQTFVYLFAVLA